MTNLSELLNAFPIKAKHKKFGSIEVFGVRTQSNVSNNLMYYTKINGDYVWVYDYETELLPNQSQKSLSNYDYDKKLLIDCEWCGTEKENPNGICRECGRFPSPSNYR